MFKYSLMHIVSTGFNTEYLYNIYLYHNLLVQILLKNVKLYIHACAIHEEQKGNLPIHC